jgi:hypothetical protein
MHIAQGMAGGGGVEGGESYFIVEWGWILFKSLFT